MSNLLFCCEELIFEIKAVEFRVFFVSIVFLFLLSVDLAFSSLPQTIRIVHDNAVWHTQSENSTEYIHCRGLDIGLNVLVENYELLFSISKSDAFDKRMDWFT